MIPPVVSASLTSSEEEPQQTSDYDPNQGNWRLPNTQPNAPISRTTVMEDRRMEERQRAIQAVRDITTGQPTPTPEESQMYDWDGQFDEMLGLPVQLRNRVSDLGTPPVRTSPKTPTSAIGTEGTPVNIRKGPELHTVTEDIKGNGTERVENWSLQGGQERTVPPTPRPQPRKIQPTEGTVDRTSPQEVHRRVDFAKIEEGPGRETLAGPRDVGVQEELLEPTPCGPPRTEDV